MSYITNLDIEHRLGTATYLQLADDDGDGVADLAVVDEARLGAEGELNGILASRFAVPIDTSAHPELADVLASIALDLAEYRLRGRRPPIAEAAEARRAAALAWLHGVVEGRIQLPASSELRSNPALGPIAASSGEQRLLTRDELRDF